MDYIISASTDIGNTKSTNQDSFSVKRINTKLGRMVFAVLCDGMGGLEKGELASASLVSAFNRWIVDSLPSVIDMGLADNVIRDEWVRIVTDYNEKIKDYGKKTGISLGTTITAFLLTDTRYYILNVGDTRAYEIYDGVSILTKDQTLVAREVEMGNLTPQQAERDPRRSVLLQCVGASDVVYPDMFFGDTKSNAVYMLCSDGFRHEISAEEIFTNINPRVMNSESEIKGKIDYLINLNKQRGERDNISSIVIRTI